MILNVDEFNVSNPFGCIESPSQVNCRLDVPHCYERSRMCIYDTQVMDETRNYAVQSTCRDGTHLRQYCGEYTGIACGLHCQMVIILDFEADGQVFDPSPTH